jgi:hypothetical protein
MTVDDSGWVNYYGFESRSVIPSEIFSANESVHLHSGWCHPLTLTLTLTPLHAVAGVPRCLRRQVRALRMHRIVWRFGSDKVNFFGHAHVVRVLARCVCYSTHLLKLDPEGLVAGSSGHLPAPSVLRVRSGRAEVRVFEKYSKDGRPGT